MTTTPTDPDEAREAAAWLSAATDYDLLAEVDRRALLTSGPLADRLNALRDLAAWLVSLDDDDPESPGRAQRRTVTLTAIVDRARAALDGVR